MIPKKSYFLIFSVAFFVTGNLVGAGILGLPIESGFAGFIPSMVGILLVGGILLFTAVVLTDVAIEHKKPTFHYPSLYHAYLGPVGRWVAVISNLVILYGFIIAYISGAATIIKSLIGIQVPNALIMLIFFAILTGFTIANPRLLRDYTTFFVILLWIFFVVLVIMGEKFVKPEYLKYADWKFLPVAMPIILTALSFHNIIPNICKDLKWNRKAILVAMFAGVLAGYAISALWVQVSLGALPFTGENSITDALQNNLPSTVPLSQIVNSPLFNMFSLLFALLAIVTSYTTNGYALMEFIEDLLVNYFKKSGKLLVILLSFLPPLIITLVYPKVFLTALDLIGGLGIAVLFGILPSMIALMRARSAGKRPTVAIAMLLIFVFILVFQIGKDTSIVNLKPRVRYVKYNFTHYVSGAAAHMADK